MHRCPPEVVIDPPSRMNDFRWCWVVCQPDAHWAPIRSGSSLDKVTATRDAEVALAIETRIWENER